MDYENLDLSPEKRLKFGFKRQLPMIFQTEVAECGLACLAMICGYHGNNTDLTTLRMRHFSSIRGANLKHLIEIASQMNVAPRALSIEMDQVQHLSLPCVLHWDMNHFIVLESIHKNHYIIHDPAKGVRKISKSEFDSKFTGVALELIPTTEFSFCDSSKPLKITSLWTNVFGLKRNLSLIICLSVLLQIFSLFAPFYLQTVVDDVLLRKDENLLVVLAAGFFFLLIIQIGTNYFREILLLLVTNKLGIQMSANLCSHLIRLPMEYFGKRHMGDVVSRFSSLEKVRSLLTTGLIAVILDGAMAITTFVVMIFYSPLLAWTVFLIVALYAVLRWLLYGSFQRINEEAIVASAKESSYFMETIRAIQTIKLFRFENGRHNTWLNHLADATSKKIAISHWLTIYKTMNGFLFGLENIIIVYLAATAVMGELMSVGMLIAFISYKERFKTSMDTLVTQLIDWKMVSLHLNRLSDIVFTKPENIGAGVSLSSTIINSETNELLAHGTMQRVGKVEVKNISFKYSESDPYVFKNLSFVVDAGEFVAITGVSGAGKTTLLKCLMGLLRPTEGEILIDDRPINFVENYRHMISGVLQDDTLMSGDISENISCFDLKADIPKVEYCAALACVALEIERMPMKYSTPINDLSNGISGGQKQRILLARALYADPKILFLDEATSHLDRRAESAINENLKNLNITRIIIAHRKESLDAADRIIFI